MELSPELIRLIRRRLLRWYSQHRRDLPWRAGEGEQGNAYHVLLSELMLQQTQVATVVAYFHRFVAALPTLAALAEAEEQRVLRLWQGLGYYRRARHLHAAAKAIVRDHQGEVPRDVESLLSLPGVGRYTAGAIASIAFGIRAPLVDGNVMRVFARLFAIEEAIDSPAVVKRMWAMAQEIVPAKRPGDFNQGLMELGAMVCTPRSPSCDVCPLRECCEAYRRGLVAVLPLKTRRGKPRAVTHHIVAVERGGEFLFHQRPVSGLWANLWQLPTNELFAEGETITARTIAAWAGTATGLKLTRPTEAASFFHQTTHRSITFVLWRTRAKSAQAATPGHIWRRLDDLDDLPLAKPQRMAIEHLR